MFSKYAVTFCLLLTSAVAWPASRPVPQPTCAPPILSTDGGFGNIEYKYVFAKVVPGPGTSAATDLARILHQVTMVANGGLTQGAQGCSVEAHLDAIDTDSSGVINMRIRVDGSCTDYSNFAKTEDQELTLMRAVVEQIVAIPGLQVGLRWSRNPPCVGGGATGSNIR